MKTFALLAVALLVVSCGTVNDDTQSDTLPDEDMDIVMPVEENDMADDVWNDDTSELDWSMEDIEAEWQAARDRSKEIDFTWLTEDEASELAMGNNISFRVIMRDDEMLPVTMDYVPGRINATVDDGVVTSFSVE